VARLRVTFQASREALSFQTGDLDPTAMSAVIVACAKFAFDRGWTLRIEKLPEKP
jgi:hypothetical protein